MTLTDQQLADIEELAGLFLTPNEIAILLDLDFDSFIQSLQNKKSPAYKHYFRGKTTSKKTIRQKVIKMAHHGSPQAEEMANEYIATQNLFEKRNHVRP